MCNTSQIRLFNCTGQRVPVTGHSTSGFVFHTTLIGSLISGLNPFWIWMRNQWQIRYDEKKIVFCCAWSAVSMKPLSFGIGGVYSMIPLTIGGRCQWHSLHVVAGLVNHRTVSHSGTSQRDRRSVVGSVSDNANSAVETLCKNSALSKTQVTNGGRWK
jgi:hypothetical protein